MRIETIAIDGFGQFHSAQLSPHAGLTVVRGPNEAGKTTLLAFTRAMLFGFERSSYPALNGGNRGGWLDVVMDDGRALRIERYGPRGGEGKLRVIENDKHLGAGSLATLLQGVETSVYKNIFAFGLGELTRFETLGADEVAARIYGAGLGTGGVSGLKVEQRLGERMEGWFKPGGSRPKLNALLKRLEEVDHDLEGRDLPGEYAEAGRELDDVNDRLADLASRYDELDRELRRQQRLDDGWETWLELGRAQEERDALGEVRTFEPDILERLSALEASLTETDRTVEAAQRERDRAQANVDEALVDEPVLAQREELEALAVATKVEIARDDERNRTERELTEARAAVDASLAGLGESWTAQRVEGFDDSIAVKSEISGRFRRSLTKASDALAAARDRHSAAQTQLEEANEQAGVAAERVVELDESLADRRPSAERDRSLQAIESLTNSLAEQRRLAADAPTDDLAAKRASLDGRRAQARELAEALRSKQTAEETLPGLQAMTDAAAARATRQYIPPVVLGVAGVVLAVVLAVLEVSTVVAIVVAAAGVGGAVVWGVALRSQSATGGAGSRERMEQQLADAEELIGKTGPALNLGSSPSPVEVERYLDDLDEERRILEREEDRAARADAASVEAERLADQLALEAERAGLSSEPTPSELDAFRKAIADDRETEAARSAAVEREAELKATAEGQAKRTADLSTELDQRLEEDAAARAAWEAWLSEHDLDPSYDRETAGRVVDSVTSAKGTVATLRKADARAEELTAEHAQYAAQVDALAPLLGDGKPAGEDLAATATLLAKLLADVLTGERERDDLVRALEDKESALTSATESRDAIKLERDSFLGDAEADDAAALRTEVGRTRQATDLDARIDNATATLTTLSGPGKALEGFLADLDGVEDIVDVRAAVSEVSGQLGDLDDQQADLNQQAGSLRTRREEMEDDAAATELRQERADLLSQLEAGARRWTVLALARQLLNRSRSIYEEAHRPAVIEKAEHFFTSWTDGRYHRIIAPLGEDVRGVERLDGVEVALAGLSRGTSEQLYLALRFGLVQHFVETSGEPLPIVMDDILVNFDAERAERAARSIEELAQTCQIIYFTCHDSTPLQADKEESLPPFPVLT